MAIGKHRKRAVHQASREASTGQGASPEYTDQALIADLSRALVDLLQVYEWLMPGIRYISVPNYQLVNEAPIKARRLVGVVEERTKGRPMVPYRLPNGIVVRVDDSAAKGAEVIDYSLGGGAIVKATRVTPEQSGEGT